MDLGLIGKRVLVTGGGRGLGGALAARLAEEGALVAVAARTQLQVEETVATMGGEAKGHVGITMDLALDGAPGHLVNRLQEAGFWPVDAVVHNLGGVLDVRDPFCSPDDWLRVWRINVQVGVELNLLLVPSMRERGWGRIVHISSIAAVENQGPVPYCSAKAALTAYARSMGRVLAPDGIIMTAVLPGAVFTEGGDWDTASRENPEHVERYLEDRMAIHRFGRTDEISGIVAFLCSEQASFFVGSVIPVDGGQGRTYFGY